MKLKLFPKFAIIIIVLSIAPLLFIGTITVNINQESLQTAILELHTHIASSVANQISAYINGIVREIDYIKENLLTEELDFTAKANMLRNFLDTHPELAVISLVSKNGAEIIKFYNPELEEGTKLKQHRKVKLFRELMSNEKIKRTVGDVYFYHNNTNRPRIDVYTKTERFIIYASLSLCSLWETIKAMKIRKSGCVLLVNRDGKIILHKEKDHLLRDISNLTIVQQAINSRFIGSSEFFDGEKEVVGSYAPLPLLGMYVIVSEPKSDAYYSSLLIRKQAMYLIIVSLIVAASIALLLTRGLTKPILEITKAAEKIARQNFSVNLKIRTNDELSDLARTFNSLAAKLKEYADIQLDKLISEKTKTEAIVFSIDDGIVMTDREGGLLLVNNRARKLLGIEGEIENKKIWEYIRSEELLSATKELLEGKTNKKEVDLSGKEFTRVYQVSAQKVRTLKGKTLGKVLVFRDVSLEKELDRMKDDFLHSITHDLKNPLTSIIGFTKFLLSGVGGKPSEKQKKMLTTIDRASARLLSMINDILDVAKLEAGKLTLQKKKFEIGEICKRVIEILQPQAAEKSLKMSLKMNKEKIELIADGDLLERVYVNLIGNAIKFTPENGQIEVMLSESNGKFESYVKDTGEGIPPEYLDKIFDKYSQVAGHRKGGTGLGLTICKHIIEAHNGKIWVESKLGEGAKFIFWIPKNG